MLEAYQLLGLHSQLVADVGVGHSIGEHLEDHVAHSLYGVLPSGSVVPDGGRHAFIDCLI